MAKVKSKGIDQLTRKLNRDLKIMLNKLFRDKNLRLQIGAIVANDIKKNVSFGSPATSTLKWRKRYGPLNNTDPAYSQGKLNAVFTGELLNDLATNVKGVTTTKSFDIEHSDKRHKKYQGVTKKIGSRSPYSEISKGLIDVLGYDYMKISDKARTKIVNLIRQEITKLLGK